MFKRLRGVKFRLITVLIPLLVAILAPSLPFLAKDASAATLATRTGYYDGNGGTKSISGLGFQPQYIFVKSDSSAATGAIKTKDMSGSTFAFANNTADSTGITIDASGFSLSSSAVNGSGEHYSYMAFAGSDCTSGGTVCIGAYTGDGTGTRAISTGFQPGLVIAKSSTSAAPSHFKTASMPTANTEFLFRQATNTATAYIGALSSGGFSVGTLDNTSATGYYYIAFKAGSSTMSEGSYTGDGTDDRNITGLGFKPSIVLVKNSNGASSNNWRPVWTTPEHYSDSSSYTGDALGATSNGVQALQSSGFQVGSLANVNESGSTMYWFAIGGDTSTSTSSGSFKMAVGSYTGTGSALNVSSLGFAPDLVIVKENSTNLAVYRMAMMGGDATAYIATTAADFTGGVTSLNSDGFSIGTSIVTNSSGQTYQWQAFGNAYNPETRSGAANFAIGSYVGNATDDRDIATMPFQPDLVVARRGAGSTNTTFRTSSYGGDQSAYLSGTADGSNLIQALNSDGFQVGSVSTINANAVPVYWFAFKSGANFSVGDYTGNGVVDRAITAPGFQPDLVWIKRSTSQVPVQRPSTLAGDSSQYFAATANATGLIKSLTSTGFTLGNNAAVNTNAGTYHYVSWRIPPSGSLTVGVVDASGTAVGSPSLNLSSVGFLYGCGSSSGTIGVSAQRIRVSNTTASPGWSLSIAANGGQTALWANGGNTIQYDYNDTTTSGCADGADADSKAGLMSINASTGTISPQSGCSSANVTKGSLSSYSQGTVDAITLLNASSSADTNCYWDFTGVGVEQIIPAEQASDTYNINMTVTITAS